MGRHSEEGAREREPGVVRVLYVDDETAGTDGPIARLATDDRFEVERATGVADALGRLGTVDCVVSGHELEGLDGLGFLRAVRDRRPALPFVLYTAQGSERIASEAFSAGATDYVRKTRAREDASVLREAVESAVAGDHTGRERTATDGPDGAPEEFDAPVPEFLARVHPADRDRVRTVVDAAREADTLDAEFRVRTPDGGHRRVKCIGEVAPNGDRPDRLVAVCFPVDERQGRAAATERERGEGGGRNPATIGQDTTAETVLAHFPAGVLVAGPDRTVVDVNGALLDLLDVDRRPDECGGHDAAAAAEAVKDRFADPEAFVERVEALVETRERALGEELELADGRTLERDFVPYTGPDGPVNLWVYRDVTDRREREARLEQQRRDLELLDRMVRHDVRNDLQTVVAYAELLRERVADEEREYAERIRASAENAVERTHTAREIAETIRQPSSDRERVSLADALGSQLDELRTSYEDAVVTVERPLPDADVLADGMLDSVFRNVLQNAVQHNDADVPTVTVTATEADDHVRVEVADNGPGVPEGWTGAVFGDGDGEREGDWDGDGERGDDGGAAAALRRDGTGIGLSLVTTLVEQYGGDVWVEENEPRGSVFTVALPTAEG